MWIILLETKIRNVDTVWRRLGGNHIAIVYRLPRKIVKNRLLKKLSIASELAEISYKVGIYYIRYVHNEISLTMYNVMIDVTSASIVSQCHIFIRCARE